MLGEIPDLKALSVAYRTVQRLELADNGLDERRFACAVDAEHTDAFARADAKIDAV